MWSLRTMYDRLSAVSLKKKHGCKSIHLMDMTILQEIGSFFRMLHARRITNSIILLGMLHASLSFGPVNDYMGAVNY